MNLPQALIDAINGQNVILVLGAGASFDASNASGEHPPSGTALKSMLANKFLGKGHDHDSLALVSAYAVNETDLITVQKFIRDIFVKFSPSRAHEQMTRFRWAGLATTNYDLLVEDAYKASPNALQKVIPRIENGDRVLELQSDPDNIIYLKLHGCITSIDNPECPLILTTDQYNDYRQGRDRVFGNLRDWAYERTLVFIGHAGGDPDLIQTIYDLKIPMISRPRHYMIKPNNEETERRYWENTKKVMLIDGTFAEFMAAVERVVDPQFMKVRAGAKVGQHPIVTRFIKHEELSSYCHQYLSSHVYYVKTCLSEITLNALDFYKGFNGDWGAIEQDFDAPRTITDELLEQVFLLEDYRAKRRLQVVLLKGHAGSGKTIVLRRAAWVAAREYDCCCLYVKDDSPLDTQAIQELVEKCGERVFVFIDNAADRAGDIRKLIRELGEHGELVSIILAARHHEWNSAAGGVEGSITDSFEVRALGKREIESLLGLLEANGALGRLTEKTQEERLHAFENLANRQLLVALHEATLGKHFEDILVDEYDSLVPAEAQHIYLTICILNRMDIPVRAGVISRIHKVDFSYFSQQLFRPLEHVVYAYEDGRIRDIVFKARHPVIAEIVFERILTNEKDRFEEYYRTINALNIDYSTDEAAFVRLTKGKTLLRLFPNREYCEEILELAEKISKGDPRLMHQRAIYEMSKSVPDFQKATALLNEAIKRQPYYKPYVHTKAELAMKRAEKARGALERDKYLNEAASLAKQSKDDRRGDSYSHHTLAKVNMMRLDAELQDGTKDFNSPSMQQIVRVIESEISTGLQECPGNSYLLTERARLAEKLSDSPKMILSLEQAFAHSPKLSYLAVQLADCYLEKGEDGKAKEIMERAIEANRMDKTLNFRYGLFLSERENKYGDAAYFLKRAFSREDRNYTAQLYYVRALFLANDFDAAKTEFSTLFTKSWHPFIEDEKQFYSPGRYAGRISALKSSYAFAIENTSSMSVMVPYSELPDSRKLSITSRIEFQLSFGFKGLRAVDASILE